MITKNIEPIYCSYPIEQYRCSEIDIDMAIKRVLHAGNYILGPELKNFEENFAKYHDVKHALGVGSGTDALYLAMRALDIGNNDEVITVSHTAVATVSAIILTGATPVLVDIDQRSFTIDPKCIERAITPKTKAIIVVHLYGYPAEMNAILSIANKFKLRVIEDCAQAHGALFNGKRVGTLGDIGCFSFYPTKNLGAIGDGGAIITNDTKIANTILELRQYGWDKDRVSQRPSGVSRLDELQAAILSVKLPKLDASNKLRQKISERYRVAFSDLPISLPPLSTPDKEHVYHLFVVYYERAKLLLDFLSKKNIMAGIHYPLPVHKHPGYTQKIVAPNELVVTESLIGCIISLPMYPELKGSQVDYVIETVNEYFSNL